MKSVNCWLPWVGSRSLFGLFGCGDGGSSHSAGTPAPEPAPEPEITTATGQFKDVNVEGLSYSSGEQSGETDALGTFTYEIHDGEPQTVTFSVNGAVLVETGGKALVTPVDAVANGSLATGEVQNIVRFLMMLDMDNNPANGITVSDNVRALEDDWEVDFSLEAEEFAAAVGDIVSAAGGADSRTAESGILA